MTTITISGAPGSGKSTVAQLLSQKTNIPYIYSGQLFRTYAQEHNMSLEAFGKYCEQHPEIDKKLDDNQLQILQKGNIILEGRIAGWIAHRNNIPAKKIFLDADLTTRTQRLIKREQGSIKQRQKEIINREKSETQRYKQYYDINLADQSIYDLIIDTSDKTPEEIVAIILNHLT